jgi:hypothetical protein
MTDIRADMEVYGSCGNRLGTVERIDGDGIKMTRHGPLAAGEHHWLPLDCVASVDEAVHLNLPCETAVMRWSAEPSEAGV